MPISTDKLRAALACLPRVNLAQLPTPLEALPRLSAALGGVEIWIKRDDCTGLALGGNKARQLEFTLGAALAEGADCVVQGAGSQSNHCRQTAAAAARLGLECHLLLQRDDRAVSSEGVPGTPQGNLLLDGILGARIHWTDTGLGPAFEAEKEALGQRLRDTRRRPFVIGGSVGRTRSAAGYALQICELAEQCASIDFTPDYLYVCSAGAAHSGLLLGARALGLSFAIQGVAPIVWGGDVPAVIAGTAGDLARELGLAIEFGAGEVRHTEQYVGPAYGPPTREAQVAIELVARTEGILLDPSYTGKAMAGLIDHIRRGAVRPGSSVVFVHTGGTPALFAYAAELSGG